MVRRLANLSKNQSFFLFGARGTGKSTLLKQLPHLKNAFTIDLLKPETEEKYALSPKTLERECLALAEKQRQQWVVLDEIQKVPKLLDTVHSLLETPIIRESKLKFVMTGSSSRKLKRGGANLLAGRAIKFSLYPLTARELGPAFDLNHALNWGSLPKLLELESSQDRSRFLKSYCDTYLKEEILVEQLIRNLDPFRMFLPLAAKHNTEVINYSNIAKDTGVDHKSVQNYYQILVDTNLGYFLEPFHRSVRKVQIQSPKFYLFDGGVKKALERTLTIPLAPQTSEYGRAFEAWFINECIRLNEYLEADLKFSYLRTKDDAELDLIIERPSGETLLVEIKSGPLIDQRHVKHLLHFSKDFPKSKLICVAQVEHPQNLSGVKVLPYLAALDLIFG